MPLPDAIEVVDSHTEGEPTRVVVSGWPQPAGDTMAERRQALGRDHDLLRRAVVLEPRGHDAIVGALLTPPTSAGSLAGVVFFNNVGTLGMCGHGLIGVVRTLVTLGRIGAGPVRIDTPVGTTQVELGPGAAVVIENVPAECHARDVALDVPGLGRVVGDVAWGGNWFFLTTLDERLELANVERLTRATAAIMDSLASAGITGGGGARIDHIEVFGPPSRSDADSRNFVLCPGGAYDRSPCGTGTSAKLAALHARGALALGQRWRQEGVCGGLFTGWLTESEGRLLPHIEGRAYVTGRATLLFDPEDPFRHGIAR